MPPHVRPARRGRVDRVGGPLGKRSAAGGRPRARPIHEIPRRPSARPAGRSARGPAARATDLASLRRGVQGLVPAVRSGSQPRALRVLKAVTRSGAASRTGGLDRWQFPSDDTRARAGASAAPTGSSGGRVSTLVVTAAAPSSRTGSARTAVFTTAKRSSGRPPSDSGGDPT